MKNKFPQRLKELREEKGLSQNRLGKLIGIHSSSINNWERGLQVPSIEVLYSLSEFFNCTAGYLLGLEDN